jgi:hypothetical protein
MGKITKAIAGVNRDKHAKFGASLGFEGSVRIRVSGGKMRALPP